SFGKALAALGLAHIGRRVGGIEIAPALERGAGAPQHRHQLLVIDQGAMRFAFVAGGADVEQCLPRRDLALDHPVERTAIQQFLGALGRLAGEMDKFGLLALLFLFRELALLPVAQFLETVDADTKFDQMEHAGSLEKAVAGQQVKPELATGKNKEKGESTALPFLNLDARSY